MEKESAVKKIKVVSNTHWDREFRQSFEKTRRRLLDMLDITLDIISKDPKFHSFTLDGHTILLDDYLEMRPEKRPLVEKLLQEGRLIAGPYYTLAEEFSISHEALVRNLIWGRKTLEKYGAKPGTVAYTPSSWGQTGQLPQILVDFGCNKMMFYRGISHHESKAEYIWEAPDGTPVYASRFALYARYNYYYQVFRQVTRGCVFEKDYNWGEYDEIPLRFSDSISGYDPSFDLKDPQITYDGREIGKSVLKMLEREDGHFTTPIFLAMMGHDISVAHPLESKMIEDAQKQLKGIVDIEFSNLEEFWKEAIPYIEKTNTTTLVGERRAYLKEGMWTYLFPGTISARTYLKQHDFEAYTKMVYFAEPLATLAFSSGDAYPVNYFNRAWQYLLSNHTHDANGGCAPDPVCLDMEYRYRKTKDIADIVTEDAIAYIAKNLAPVDQKQDAMQLVVFNTLPFTRNAIVRVDLEVPKNTNAKSFTLEHKNHQVDLYQPVTSEGSSVFIDNVWEVPTILTTNRIIQYTALNNISPLGYQTYTIVPQSHELRNNQSLITDINTLENKFIRAKVNSNGSINIYNKETGVTYENCNYFTDEGECGNAWQHENLAYDKKYNSLGEQASIYSIENGLLRASIVAEINFKVPVDYTDGTRRNELLTKLAIKTEYILEHNSKILKIKTSINNTAKDHLLKINIPTGLETTKSWADSHFDVVSRDITIPNSTGWAEKPQGTHPLRTFVSLSDSKNGCSLLTKGIFEYEVLNEASNTIALTLIRACRIKLKVSEEKIAELPDEGIQCPGLQTFEYAIYTHPGNWEEAEVINEAASYYTPLRAVMTGRGKGTLAHDFSYFSLNTKKVHVTAVKRAEDGSGTIIRLFNPSSIETAVEIIFGKTPTKAYLCKMDESDTKPIAVINNTISLKVGFKKIITLKID